MSAYETEEQTPAHLCQANYAARSGVNMMLPFVCDEKNSNYKATSGNLPQDREGQDRRFSGPHCVAEPQIN